MEYVNQAALEIVTATGTPNARLNQIALEVLQIISPLPLPWIPEGGARATGGGVDPQIVLQVSNDGGKTWGNERPASIGKIGDFRRLVKWRRTGRSNDRAIRVICSEPIPNLALIGCDVDAH